MSTDRGTTRRRGHVLEQAIYEAAMAELGERGYAQLSMEGVASRARTGKAALYRRWSSKRDLILDALTHALPIAPEIARLRIMTFGTRQSVRSLALTVGTILVAAGCTGIHTSPPSLSLVVFTPGM